MSPPPEANPVSLRISVTDRCQYRCVYCTPAAGVKLFDRSRILRYEQIVAFVRILRRHVGLSKVHLTGGEPLVRRDICRLVEMLADEGVGDLAMTTNGFLLAELAGDLKRAGLMRVNVSLDSLRPGTFRRITRGGDLERTLRGIEAAGRSDLSPIKLNTTLLGGINDDEVVPLTRFALGEGLSLRFIELMPMGPAVEDYERRFVPARQVRVRLAEHFDVSPMPRERGSSARWFAVCDDAGRSGRVGLISPCSEPFCADCNRLRLTACGELVGCLAMTGGRDISPLLPVAGEADADAILAEVQTALAQKRAGRRFPTDRPMAQIGG